MSRQDPQLLGCKPVTETAKTNIFLLFLLFYLTIHLLIVRSFCGVHMEIDEGVRLLQIFIAEMDRSCE